MTTRIKYMYDGPIGISKKVYRVNGRDVRILIHTEEFYFEIVDLDGQAIIKGGNTKNVAVLKIQAKKGLENLGYIFGHETRKKRG